MKRYIVGIDLGTSNTVVAYAAGDGPIQLFAVDQLVGLGEVAARPLLPSLRYHPAPGELRPADLQLPWPAADIAGLESVVAGSLARDLGAQVPGRLVASAKSWLSHAAVDRLAPILPWGADPEVPKVSPVAASASYLAHVREAWNRRFPEAPLESQEVVLTVPASFDEGARALTVEAAHLAKLSQVRLLEEPQAAFYDWLFRHRQSLGAELRQTRLVLVCDVGGGTTDLTLIRVETPDGEPRLTRIGVGDHLMLGGDNMDLALAHLVEPRLESAGRLSAARFAQLIQRCRVAKEALLAPGAPDSAAVTLLGGGARLVGGARSAELGQEEVRQVIVEGFFPPVDADAEPERRRSGIVEFGLPYPADPAITRHLAAFLRRHAAASRQALGTAGEAGPAVPDTLLFNGGVFRAEALTRRLEDLLGSWRGTPLRVLHNDNPDLAVARGAVAYALVRRGQGIRIGGGSARSYFLLLEDGRGICVLPRGTEEGHEIRLENRSFALRLGQPVRFNLVSSVADTAYAAGDIVDIDAAFVRLPPLATVVPAQSGSGGSEVPVAVVSLMTEVGTLEIRCVNSEDPQQAWRLEFQLRGEAAADVPAVRLPPRFADAVKHIDCIFGARSQAVDSQHGVRRLRGQLEHLLGKREDWDIALLRAVFDALWARVRRRRRSAEHERLWLNLAGYCIRPGLGHPLDEWRVEQLWSLFPAGLQYPGESQNWSEWWTLWRRAAGGLAPAAQLRLMDEIAPHLHPEDGKGKARPSGPVGGSHDDMVRLAASLERLPVERKIEIGECFLVRLQKPAEKTHTWWAIGRLGARQPLYGSAHQVVPAEAASRWLEPILTLDWKKVEPAAFAAAQIARLTGDRSRDLAPEIRERVVQKLTAMNAPASWMAMVETAAQLAAVDAKRAFGESLPAGLKLID